MKDLLSSYGFGGIPAVGELVLQVPRSRWGNFAAWKGSDPPADDRAKRQELVNMLVRVVDLADQAVHLLLRGHQIEMVEELQTYVAVAL